MNKPKKGGYMKLLSQEKQNAISQLIPIAEKEADAKLEKLLKNSTVSEEKLSAIWNGFYHDTMDKIAESEGLRVYKKVTLETKIRPDQKKWLYAQNNISDEVVAALDGHIGMKS